MKTVGVLICITCWIMSGCIKEVDLEIPAFDNQLVLNGILHPDSLVRVTLTKSSYLADTSETFPVIKEAVVQLWEEQALIGTLAYEDETYTLDYCPLAGKQYTIEVVVDGYDMLRASDRVPSPPSVYACYKVDAKYSASANTAIQIGIRDNREEANYYWITLLGNYTNNDSIAITYKVRTLLSFSTLTDRFNSYVDNTSGGARAYDDYIRVEDTTLESDSASMDIFTNGPLFRFDENGRRDSSQSHTLSIVSASRHYDRYLKSSIIYYFNNEFYDDPNPFAEPARVYSNIENGTGIFAAHNSTVFEISNFLCP